MADQNTSIVNNDNLLMSYFEKRGIATLHEAVGFYQLADKFPLPKGSGQQMTWNGWRKIAAASSTLAEASANSAVTLSSRKINVTVQSFGRHVKITSLAELTMILDPNEGAMQELEQSAALTQDNVIQLAVFKNVLAQVGQNVDVKTKLFSAWQANAASSFCANTGTTANSRQFGFPVVFGASSTKLSLVSKTAPSISAIAGPIGVRKAVTRLRRLAVPKFDGNSYRAVAHPNWISALLSNSDYKQYVINYEGGPSKTMFAHAVTRVHAVDIMESPNVPRYATSALSCTPLFICGKGALGVTELDGGIQMIIKRSGPQSVSDPYNQTATVSYVLRAAAAALNPSCGVILLNVEKPNVGG